MNVVTVYLWLDGCAAEALQESNLERVLHLAVEAAKFTLLYSHTSTADNRIVALAVVGESHVVLHADPVARTMFGEVLSCTTQEAAEAAIDVMRSLIPHETATHEMVKYQVESGFD